MEHFIKTLVVDIVMNKDDFAVYVLEPESGEDEGFHYTYSECKWDGNDAMISDIGTEICSWISLWKDEMDELT